MPLPGTILEPSNTESEFVRSALLSSIRIDGRSFLETRDLQVNFSAELGWVEVRSGATRVLATTYASLVPPREDRPYEGFLEIRSEIQPMASVQFERNRTGEEEVLFERGLDKAIRRSECVDREALCVVAGQKVWSLTLTVHVLCAQSSALDAAVLAGIFSLRHFRRPDTSIESGSDAPISKSVSNSIASRSGPNISSRPRVIVHDVTERVPIPIAMHHHPLCVTFAIFDKSHMASSVVSGVGGKASMAAVESSAEGDELEGVIILIDPSPLEATLCTSKMHVVANAQGEICVLDKAGGRPLGEAVVERVIQIARRRVKELALVVEKKLQDDAKKRVLEVI